MLRGTSIRTKRTPISHNSLGAVVYASWVSSCSRHGIYYYRILPHIRVNSTPYMSCSKADTYFYNPACFYTKPTSNQTRILWLAGDRVTNPVCSCTELVKTQYLHWAIQRKLPKSIKIYPSPPNTSLTSWLANLAHLLNISSRQTRLYETTLSLDSCLRPPASNCVLIRVFIRSLLFVIPVIPATSVYLYVFFTPCAMCQGCEDSLISLISHTNLYFQHPRWCNDVNNMDH